MTMATQKATKRKALAVAKKYGAVIEEDSSAVMADLPEGLAWAANGSYCVIAGKYSGSPMSETWSDLIEQMEWGVLECECESEETCAACTRE